MFTKECAYGKYQISSVRSTNTIMLWCAASEGADFTDLTPDEARHLAHLLIDMADKLEGKP